MGPTVQRRKGTWIRHILLKNRLPKHVTEETYLRQEDGEEDVSSYWMTLRKRGGYWKLKEEALDCTHWITRFGRDYTTAVGQTTLLVPNLQMWPRAAGWRSAAYTVSTMLLKGD